MKFLERFLKEKEMSLTKDRTVEIDNMTHIVQLQMLIDFTNSIDKKINNQIEKTLTKLDFLNNQKEIKNYIEHLLKSMIKCYYYS
jgi:hypothetical protein